MNPLLVYGRKLFEEGRMIEQRKIGIFDHYESFSLELVKSIINVDDYDYQICEKHNETGFSMDWHLDDGVVVKHSKSRLPTHGHHIFIDSNKTIYYAKRKPIYSVLVYDNTYGVDFTGGELEFCDGTIILPNRGMYVLFNSDELHRVNKIKSGTRNTWLIKFYPKTVT